MKTPSKTFYLVTLLLCAILVGSVTNTLLIANTDLTLGWRVLICGGAGFLLSLVWPCGNNATESN